MALWLLPSTALLAAIHVRLVVFSMSLSMSREPDACKCLSGASKW